MSHTFIPTLPQIIRTVPARHKRDDLPPRPVGTDPLSEAACTNDTGHGCLHSTCPRHCPAAYADMMARHATDSL